MSRITPGKWSWKLAVLPNGDERVIFVTEDGAEIHPTLDDVELMSAAPEMYELISSLARLPDEQCLISPLIRKARRIVERVNVKGV